MSQQCKKKPGCSPLGLGDLKGLKDQRASLICFEVRGLNSIKHGKEWLAMNESIILFGIREVGEARKTLWKKEVVMLSMLAPS